MNAQPSHSKRSFFFYCWLLMSTIYSCKSHGIADHSIRLEGNIEVLHHSRDRSRGGKAVLEGFVYSRDTQQYLLGAVITIQDSIDLFSDDKGYFYFEGQAGRYQIRCKYAEHHELTLSSVKVRENERILFFFTLGNTTLY